jgi:four helix bundle protein
LEKSRSLVTEIYKQTSSFPDSEKFGITSQLRRAVVSISNNIAEGAARRSNVEFKRFLNIAYGSSIEVENMLIISTDLKMLDTNPAERLTNHVIEIEKMLYTLINK